MSVAPGYPIPTSDSRWWGSAPPVIPTDPPLVIAAGLPTLPEIRAWCEVGTSVSDEQLQQVLDAEVELQAARLGTLPEGYPDTLPTSLRQALYRRVARELAARGVPLGMTGADEYGPVVLPAYDTEIQRLEAPWRDLPIG